MDDTAPKKVSTKDLVVETFRVAGTWSRRGLLRRKAKDFGDVVQAAKKFRTVTTMYGW